MYFLTSATKLSGNSNSLFIRTDIARSLNTQALVRQVDIEFGANTLGHNVPSRLNAHFARLRGSHPHDPEVERETTAFLVAAGIRAIRYAAHPNPRHPSRPTRARW